MGKINVLDKHIAEMIAAGEVVERPSSVIKELVENSIDAGADAITVEIKNGGTTFMRVTDNGSGIMREDVRVAFKRHATSKVKYQNDLDSISTLGFRGEALASICAVSHLELITKTKDEEVGTKYTISGSDEVSLDDVGCVNGTTIIIRDLFYNIPARMKFLKKDVSEGNAVSNVMDKIALSHPEISFTYIKDSKQTLKTSGDGKLLSAIYSVYGRDFANGLIPVDYELNGVSVKGYISKPQNARANRNMQNFFINSRFVKCRTAMAAIEEACKGSVMVGKFPSCVLNIQMSFAAVDVNVHPAKVEVRFVNERPVFDAVYHAVKSALSMGDKRKDAVFGNADKHNRVNPFTMAQRLFRESDAEKNDVTKSATKKVETASQINDPFDFLDTIPVADMPKHRIDMNVAVSDSADKISFYTKKPDDNKAKTTEHAPKTSVETTTVKSDTVFADNKSTSDKAVESGNLSVQTDTEDVQIKPLIDQDIDSFKYIGEAFRTYIIIEKNEKELVLIDKHAAHERIIYEKLKSDKGCVYSQMLLEPVTVTLNKIDYDSAVSNIDMFKQTGFDIEDFGNGVILVRSAPQYLDKEDIEQIVIEMSGYLTENKRDINAEQMDWIFHNVACRAAIKAGNVSTQAELVDLARKLENDDTLKYCPHGRPLCIVLKKHEIEKQFGRV